MGVSKDLEKAKKRQEEAERRLRDAEKNGQREQIQSFAELAATYANQVIELLRQKDKSRRRSDDSSSDSDSSSSDGSDDSRRKRKSKKKSKKDKKEKRERKDDRKRGRGRSLSRSRSRSRSPERRRAGEQDRKRPRHEGHGRPRTPSASSVSSRERDGAPGVDACWHCGQRGHKKKDCPTKGRPGGFGGPGYQGPGRDRDQRPGHAPMRMHDAGPPRHHGDPAMIRCLCCGAPGHKAPSCPKRKGVQAPPNACYVCLQQGHLARDCPQRATDMDQAPQPPIAQPSDYPLQGTWQ